MYPDIESALAAVCEHHNVRGCASCNKVDGECDYGDCTESATHNVECRNSNRILIEIRPSCTTHARPTPLGVGYGAITIKQK